MNNTVIHGLYDTVPHPPQSYLGPSHTFRSADGGGNNLQNPDLGRAGTPYARSVQGKAGLPRTSLPDAGLIFDTILRRKGVRLAAPLTYLTTDSQIHIASKPFRRNVQLDLCFCIYRHTLFVPHEFQEHLYQRFKLISRFESSLWQQYISFISRPL